jgi:hypothetical protein
MSTAKPAPKRVIYAEISKVQPDWLKVTAATPEMAVWVKDNLPEYTDDQHMRRFVLETATTRLPVEFGIPVSKIYDIAEVCAWFNENHPGK